MSGFYREYITLSQINSLGQLYYIQSVDNSAIASHLSNVADRFTVFDNH